MAKKKGSARKIDHVIVLMLENRSFDHIFGFRSGVEGLKGDEENLADPSQPAGEGNPSFFLDNAARYVVRSDTGRPPSSTPRTTSFSATKTRRRGAKAQNDGFVKSYHGNLIA